MAAAVEALVEPEGPGVALAVAEHTALVEPRSTLALFDIPSSSEETDSAERIVAQGTAVRFADLLRKGDGFCYPGRSACRQGALHRRASER